MTRMLRDTKSRRWQHRLSEGETCSNCGLDGVTWKRVINTVTGHVGLRWRCTHCGASRFLVDPDA